MPETPPPSRHGPCFKGCDAASRDLTRALLFLKSKSSWFGGYNIAQIDLPNGLLSVEGPPSKSMPLPFPL